jgi:hypothetical protein
MKFSAKYAGWCEHSDCSYGDNRIRPGDTVEYLDNDLMHTECAAHMRRRPPTCPDCNLIHAGECP